MEKFVDRQEAGVILAAQLKDYNHRPNMITLALPRGGVPVAYEIAKTLAIPLDVFIVRKLGVPGHEEFAMGAIASGDVIVLNEEVIQTLNIPKKMIDSVIESEKKELLRRQDLYRTNQSFPILKDKIVLLVDDGIATGFTMKAAISAVRAQKPAQIIVAAPVAPLEVYNEITKLVDKVICLLNPINFYAVGLWYKNFSQTNDTEVCELLKKANQKNEI